MTKEKLISDICWNPISDTVSKSIKKSLNEFFESNVCIHKGENRHKCADVLHEHIEQGGELQYKDENVKWWCHVYLNHTEYRIKPSEPIYEWQWYWVEDGLKIYTKERHTELEAQEHLSPTHQKDEETKRERK